MKKLASAGIAAILLLAQVAPAQAATLLYGEQIKRVWPLLNNNGESGLKITGNVGGLTLNIIGTISGSDLYSARSITGTDFYSARYAGGGLTSCSNSTTSKLLYNSATKTFSCGTDQTGTAGPWFGTGNVLVLTNNKFVKKAGDTMTGALIVQATLSGENLIVSGVSSFSGASTFKSTIAVKSTISASGTILTRGTLSGKNLIVSGVSAFSGTALFKGQINTKSTIAASGAIITRGALSGANIIVGGVGSFSGTAVFKGQINGKSTLSVSGSIVTRGTLSGQNLLVANTSAFSGAAMFKSTISTKGSISATGSITSRGTLSGATFVGAGIGDCNGSANKVVYFLSTKLFGCAADQNSGGGGGISFTTGSGVFVNQAGDTMTGALTIRLTGGSDTWIGLKVLQTISGSYIRADKLLTSSGSLNVESGSVLGKQVVINAADTGAQLTLNTVTGAITGAFDAKDSAGNIIFRVQDDGTVSAGNLVTATGAMQVGWNPVLGRRVGYNYLSTTSVTIWNAVGMTGLLGSGTLSNVGTLSNKDFMKFVGTNVPTEFSGLVDGGNAETQIDYSPKMTLLMRTSTSFANQRFLMELSSIHHSLNFALSTAATGNSSKYFGVGWEDGVAGGKWLCCSGDGSNHSCLDMGLAPSASNEYLLEADLSNPNYLVCTVTANQTKVRKVKTNNLPAGNTGLFPAAGGFAKTGSANSQTWYGNKLGLEQN